jgi:hypothetical protein
VSYLDLIEGDEKIKTIENIIAKSIGFKLIFYSNKTSKFDVLAKTLFKLGQSNKP